MRTRNAVAEAAVLLDYGQLVVVNLLMRAAHDVAEMSLVGADPTGWMNARPSLYQALSTSDGVLAAWGVSP